MITYHRCDRRLPVRRSAAHCLRYFAGSSLAIGLIMSSTAASSQGNDLIGPNVPAASSLIASRNDWRVIVGAGGLALPSFEGSRDYTGYPVPLLDITWRNRAFLNLEHGLGIYALRSDRFQLGLSVGYARGRDQDASNRLRGLGDIDAAARSYLFARYSVAGLTLGVDLSRDFGGSDGFQVRPIVSAPITLTKNFRITPEISATWSNEAYMSTFFGVSQSQSLRSGLPRFDAQAGFKRVDFRISAVWNLSERWFTSASFGLGYLLGDAADSPISVRRNQPSFGLFVGYRF